MLNTYKTLQDKKETSIALTNKNDIANVSNRQWNPSQIEMPISCYYFGKDEFYQCSWNDSIYDAFVVNFLTTKDISGMQIESKVGK